MSRLPGIFDGGRARGVALVAAFAVGQAAAAGVAAFATRDVFAAFAAAERTPPLDALILMAAAGAVIALLRVAERTVAESVGQKYAAALRKTLFRHLTHMPVGDLSRRRVGSLAIRFVGDLAAVKAWVSQGVARLISAAIVLPGAIAALVLLNPALAGAVAAPLALALAVMALLAPRLAPLHRRLRSRRARLAADVNERIPVAPELRLLGRSGQEFRRLDKSARALRRAAVARAKASALLRAVPEIGAATAGAALLWTALAGGAASAEAAGALAVLAILTLPLRDLATVWDRRRAWEVARDKCQAILDAPLLEQLAEPQDTQREGPARLVLEALTSGPLNEIDVTAEPGEKIAIVGGNGVGKSSLLALAAGLAQADSGRLTLDGRDIRALRAGQRRDAIAYVGPRSPILKGSLRRALTLGIEPRPDDAEIEAMARRYGLDAVLERLGGLDGQVAEAGRNLSSGEARRLHLVRAALSDAGLLLLDEPDDALDAEGRASVERLVKETRATTLLVTHDPALARRADRLWYLAADGLHALDDPAAQIDGAGPVAAFFKPRRAA